MRVTDQDAKLPPDVGMEELIDKFTSPNAVSRTKYVYVCVRDRRHTSNSQAATHSRHLITTSRQMTTHPRQPAINTDRRLQTNLMSSSMVPFVSIFTL